MKRWYFNFQFGALAISAAMLSTGVASASSTWRATGPMGGVVVVVLVTTVLIGLRSLFPPADSGASLVRRALGIKDYASYSGYSGRGRLALCTLESLFVLGTALGTGCGWNATPLAFGAFLGSMMELLALAELLPDNPRGELPG
jgi:hypothetical protein